MAVWQLWGPLLWVPWGQQRLPGQGQRLGQLNSEASWVAHLPYPALPLHLENKECISMASIHISLFCCQTNGLTRLLLNIYTVCCYYLMGLLWLVRVNSFFHVHLKEWSGYILLYTSAALFYGIDKTTVLRHWPGTIGCMGLTGATPPIIPPVVNTLSPSLSVLSMNHHYHHHPHYHHLTPHHIIINWAIQ